jgi:branched-chain amino acid transport system ATP-binding protein
MTSTEQTSAEQTGIEQLSVEGVSLSFGSIVALEDVSFSVNRGERLGIIGPNGAGKTSLLNCLNGVVQPQAGRVRLDGVEMLGRPGDKFIRLGVGRTFQGVSLQPSATVAENILFGCDYLMHASLLESAFSVGRARTERRRNRKRVEEIMGFLGIGHLADTLAGSLPWGRQKIVEIGRALAADPKILLLDEPTSGMSHEEKIQVSICLARLQSEIGLTQILIEHDANFVSDLCNRVVVLDYGKVIAEGPPSEVMTNPLVVAAYLGSPATDNEAGENGDAAV